MIVFFKLTTTIITRWHPSLSPCLAVMSCALLRSSNSWREVWCLTIGRRSVPSPHQPSSWVLDCLSACNSFPLSASSSVASFSSSSSPSSSRGTKVEPGKFWWTAGVRDTRGCEEEKCIFSFCQKNQTTGTAGYVANARQICWNQIHEIFAITSNQKFRNLIVQL